MARRRLKNGLAGWSDIDRPRNFSGASERAASERGAHFQHELWSNYVRP